MEQNKPETHLFRSIREQGAKKAYVRPHLTHFGSLVNLTRATGSCEASDGNATQACFVGINSMTHMYSDAAMKENIVQIGKHFSGIGLYLFDYKPAFQSRCGSSRQFGVMAQEVEQVMPEAVKVSEDGYKMVDYSLLGIRQAVR